MSPEQRKASSERMKKYWAQYSKEERHAMRQKQIDNFQRMRDEESKEHKQARMKKTWAGNKRYWEEMTTKEKKALSNKRKKSWTTARRKERSKKSKQMWAEASEEKKAKMKANIVGHGFDTQSPAKLKKTLEKAVAARDNPQWRKKLSKIKKKMCQENPEFIANLNAAYKKWAKTPEAQAKLRKNLEAMKNRKKKFIEDSENMTVSEIKNSLNSLGDKQRTLYEIASNLVSEYGVTVERNMPLEYYEEIIGFFKPDQL